MAVLRIGRAIRTSGFMLFFLVSASAAPRAYVDMRQADEFAEAAGSDARAVAAGVGLLKHDVEAAVVGQPHHDLGKVIRRVNTLATNAGTERPVENAKHDGMSVLDDMSDVKGLYPQALGTAATAMVKEQNIAEGIESAVAPTAALLQSSFQEHRQDIQTNLKEVSERVTSVASPDAMKKMIPNWLKKDRRELRELVRDEKEISRGEAKVAAKGQEVVGLAQNQQ